MEKSDPNQLELLFVLPSWATMEQRAEIDRIVRKAMEEAIAVLGAGSSIRSLR